MNEYEDKGKDRALWDRFRQDTDLTASACPGENDLAALLDGRLSDEGRQTLEGHLAACDTCLEAWIELRSMLGEEIEDAPGCVAERARGLATGRARPFPAKVRVQRFLRIAAAAACIAAACAGGLHLGSDMVLSANQARSEMSSILAPFSEGGQDTMTGVLR